MLARGQILLSFEQLIRDVEAYIDNFKFDWEKARAGVAPLPKDSPADLRERRREHLKRTLSPILAPTGYLPGFRDKVKRLLADIGTPGDPSLRRILKLRFPVDDPDRCVKSLRVVKVELIRSRDMEFLGVDRSTRPRKLSRRSGTRPHPTTLSPVDADRCERIGREQIERMTNPELWTRYRAEERRLKPVGYSGFRHSLNRIRVFHKLPSSWDIQKKVTSLGHPDTDQE